MTDTTDETSNSEAQVQDAAPAQGRQLAPQRSTFDLPDVNLVQNSPFMSSHAFAHAHRMANVLANTSMVPNAYRNVYWDNEKKAWIDNTSAVGNCMIAIDLANRLGTGVMEVMQNVDVIYGRPAMRAILSTALVNKFVGPGRPYQHELRYESNGLGGDDYGVRAYTVAADGTRLEGPWITWKLVKAEGWNERRGNKWKTIPDKMFPKRAASWWADLHAPHITLGLMDPDEVQDAFPEEAIPTRAALLESKLADAGETVAQLAASTVSAAAFSAATTSNGGESAAEATAPADPAPEKDPKPRSTRRKVKAERAKCDGNHGGPRCADPECWNTDEPAGTEPEPEPAATEPAGDPDPQPSQPVQTRWRLDLE